MIVLVGCECSGRVGVEFALLGAKVYTCDLKSAMYVNVKFKNGGSCRHLQMDVFEAIDKIKPDLGIMHPPCTFLSGSGARWLDDERYPTRRKDMEDGFNFALRLWNSKIKHICIENPVGSLSTFGEGYPKLGKPSCIVQPWQFGEEIQKTTCLWLKNLPPLVPTKIVGKGEFIERKSRYEDTEFGVKEIKGYKIPKWYSDAKSNDLEKTRELRSVTTKGIAKAMATQWSKYITELDEIGSLFLI